MSPESNTRSWIARWVVVAAATLPTALALAQSGALTPAQMPINAIIGDDSFTRTFGEDAMPAEATEEFRIRTHLEYVEATLRRRDVSRWPAARRRARLHSLDLLREYRENGMFPRNFDHPDERRPCFIDREGRICAVGYLVERTAGRAVAEAINAKFQYELLLEMDDQRLDAWAATSGLTPVELAMIQPAYAPPAATATAYGASCSGTGDVPTHVIGDVVAHFGLYSGFRSRAPSWWVQAPATAEWVGSAQRLEPGAYTVHTTFDLTGMDPATAKITGLWAANPDAEIVLNGTPTGQVQPSVPGATALVAFELDTGFVTGENRLAFRLPVLPNEDFFGVLVADLSGTANRRGTPTPIPGLVNTGSDGAGGRASTGSPSTTYVSDEPPLRAEGRPISVSGQWQTGFAVTVDAKPDAPVALLLALKRAQIPLGHGCEVLIDPSTFILQVPARSGPTGSVRVPLAMPPANWSIRGFSPLSFSVQAAILDPSLPYGFGLTQGLAATTGS